MPAIVIMRTDVYTGNITDFTRSDIAAIMRNLEGSPLSPEGMAKYLDTLIPMLGQNISVVDTMHQMNIQRINPTRTIYISAHPSVKPDNLAAAVQVAANLGRTERAINQNYPFGVRWYFHIHAVLTVLLGIEIANQLQPSVQIIDWIE